jgi:anti-sigma B factor antagonist
MTSSKPSDSEPWAQAENGAERFCVTDAAGAEECVVRVSGELDHDTVPALRAALRRCEEAGSGRVLVDCSALGFCDSSGLNLLLEARSRAGARGAAIVLVGLGPRVARVFDLTGAASLFPRYPTVADARAAQ